eukprot:jgi/Botrbrau1/10591/Bobra.0358s0011.1
MWWEGREGCRQSEHSSGIGPHAPPGWGALAGQECHLVNAGSLLPLPHFSHAGSSEFKPLQHTPHRGDPPGCKWPQLCSLGLLVWDSGTSSSPCPAEFKARAKMNPVNSKLFSLLDGTRTWPSHRCSHSNRGLGGTCLHNTHAIVTGTGTDGTEALLLATVLPGSSSSGRGAGSLSTAAALGLMRHLAGVPWLAKNVIWLMLDPSCPSPTLAMQAWLDVYTLKRLDVGALRFPRAGLIQQAVILDIPGDLFPHLTLASRGFGSQLANLDLYELVATLATSLNLPISIPVEREPCTSRSWAEGHPLAAHLCRLQRLLQSAWRQGLGLPDGPHGPLLFEAVDAVTIVGSPYRAQTGSRQERHESLLTLTIWLESVFRSLNNLSERLHHSTALYVLLSPTTFLHTILLLPPLVACILIAVLHLQAAERAQGAGSSTGQATQAPDLEGMVRALWGFVLLSFLCSTAVPPLLRHTIHTVPQILATRETLHRSPGVQNVMSPWHCMRMLLRGCQPGAPPIQATPTDSWIGSHPAFMPCLHLLLLLVAAVTACGVVVAARTRFRKRCSPTTAPFEQPLSCSEALGKAHKPRSSQHGADASPSGTAGVCGTAAALASGEVHADVADTGPGGEVTLSQALGLDAGTWEPSRALHPDTRHESKAADSVAGGPAQGVLQHTGTQCGSSRGDPAPLASRTQKEGRRGLQPAGRPGWRGRYHFILGSLGRWYASLRSCTGWGQPRSQWGDLGSILALSSVGAFFMNWASAYLATLSLGPLCAAAAILHAARAGARRPRRCRAHAAQEHQEDQDSGLTALSSQQTSPSEDTHAGGQDPVPHAAREQSTADGHAETREGEVARCGAEEEEGLVDGHAEMRKIKAARCGAEEEESPVDGRAGTREIEAAWCGGEDASCSTEEAGCRTDEGGCCTAWAADVPADVSTKEQGSGDVQQHADRASPSEATEGVREAIHEEHGGSADVHLQQQANGSRPSWGADGDREAIEREHTPADVQQEVCDRQQGGIDRHAEPAAVRRDQQAVRTQARTHAMPRQQGSVVQPERKKGRKGRTSVEALGRETAEAGRGLRHKCGERSGQYDAPSGPVPGLTGEGRPLGDEGSRGLGLDGDMYCGTSSTSGISGRTLSEGETHRHQAESEDNRVELWAAPCATVGRMRLAAGMLALLSCGLTLGLVGAGLWEAVPQMGLTWQQGLLMWLDLRDGSAAVLFGVCLPAWLLWLNAFVWEEA